MGVGGFTESYPYELNQKRAILAKKGLSDEVAKVRYAFKQHLMYKSLLDQQVSWYYGLVWF